MDCFNYLFALMDVLTIYLPLMVCINYLTRGTGSRAQPGHCVRSAQMRKGCTPYSVYSGTFRIVLFYRMAIVFSTKHSSVSYSWALSIHMELEVSYETRTNSECK